MTTIPANTDPKAVFRFVVAMGRGLHRYGAPVHRLERALSEIALALGLEASFLATPTSLMTTAEFDGDQKTHLERQNSGEVDLGKLAALDDLARRATNNEVALEEATVAVSQIMARPSRYPAVLQVLAFATSSGGFACFLGAGWREIVAGFFGGSVIGILSLLLAEDRRGADLFKPLAAFLLAFFVPFLDLLMPLSVPVVVLAGLIVLVPGLVVTQAVTELAQSSLVSGTSRLFGAALVFLMLAFGSILGSTASTQILGQTPVRATSGPMPFWVVLLAVLGASLSFMVMFKANRRDFVAILIAALLTFLTARFTVRQFPDVESAPLFAAFVGAVVSGLVSNTHARMFRRPALVTRVPSMMFLVPGSLGFRAVAMFGANDPLGGVSLVFTAALIAVAIATGLFTANALVAPRQRL